MLDVKMIDVPEEKRTIKIISNIVLSRSREEEKIEDNLGP